MNVNLALKDIVEKVEQDRNELKYKIFFVKAAIVVVIFISIILIKTSLSHADVQEGIAQQIIRFHCLANSDSAEDQKLKLKVKNEVVSYLQKKLDDTKDKQEAEIVIQKELPNIIRIAENKIKKEGYSYKVTANLEQTYFPVKVYGDLTFPSGEYEALRIKIGKAEGRNWWCVMFPSLCVVNETYSVVPEDSKEKLDNVLTDEEYNEIAEDEHVEVRFQIADFFKNLW
ncbi:stage II sporulation protein required for processing of pro-sigma-E [Lachnospiraceae bacterium KM106-2]|nr:stage II sporulation protein required for processing of pro-sigma-E [Lachnospiraceae bacterium KM106-2]